MNTPSAAYAAAEVQTIDKLDSVQRRRVGQIGFDAVSPFDFLPDASKNLLLVLGSHLLVMFLKKLVERRDVVWVQVQKRRCGGPDCAHACQRGNPLRQESSSRHFLTTVLGRRLLWRCRFVGIYHRSMSLIRRRGGSSDLRVAR